MKTNNPSKMLAIIAAAMLASTSWVLAQTNAAQPAATATVVLSSSAAEVAQLAQAKISDEIILAFIKNSGKSYALDANEIIYLRQQGVSEKVIAAMLNQPRTASVASPTASGPPPVDSTASTVPTYTAPSTPAVTYVQSTPDYDYQPYYYPYDPYAYVPPVVFGWGWGWGGWHGGGGFHGGGGWHGGGGGGFHGHH